MTEVPGSNGKKALTSSRCNAECGQVKSTHTALVNYVRRFIPVAPWGGARARLHLPMQDLSYVLLRHRRGCWCPPSIYHPLTKTTRQGTVHKPAMTAQHPALQDLRVGRERGWAGAVLPALHVYRLILCTSLAYLPLSLAVQIRRTCWRQWLSLCKWWCDVWEKIREVSWLLCYEQINYRCCPRLVASIMASVPHRYYEWLYVKKKWEAVYDEHISRGELGSQGISYCVSSPSPLEIFYIGRVLEKDTKTWGMHIFNYPQNSFPQIIGQQIKQESFLNAQGLSLSE